MRSDGFTAPRLSLPQPRPAGARDRVDGKIALQRRIDARTLGFDPSTFQFKSGGDHRGVTDRLSGVQSWNPLAAGKTIVYEYADGRRVIADGHQRLGLAKRLVADGHAPIKLNAFVLQQRQGWTPPDVRAYAAIKNMHESSGKPLDMAKVMRERPDLVAKAALPLTDVRLQEAKALSRLSAPAFDMVAAGAARSDVAAAVGEAVPAARHHDMLKEMVKAKVASGQHARLYVSQALAAPQWTETTASLFGSETETRSLLKERAAVLDRALTSLKSDKRIFAMLGREHTTIEQAGNKLASGANAARAVSAGEMAAIVEKLATQRGAVSTMLDAAAAKVATGEAPSKAARAFVSSVRAMAKDGRATSLVGASPAATPPAVPPQARAAMPVLGLLAPLGIAAAGVIAFDARRNQAEAAGASPAKTYGSATIAGASAAALTAGVGYGISKGVGALARLAPRLAPALGPVALAAAVGGMGYGAYKGYRQTGTLRGAALGAMSGGQVLESMRRTPPPQSAPMVTSYTRTYRTGPKAGMTETVTVRR